MGALFALGALAAIFFGTFGIAAAVTGCGAAGTTGAIEIAAGGLDAEAAAGADGGGPSELAFVGNDELASLVGATPFR